MTKFSDLTQRTESARKRTALFRNSAIRHYEEVVSENRRIAPAIVPHWLAGRSRIAERPANAISHVGCRHAIRHLPPAGVRKAGRVNGPLVCHKRPHPA